MSECMATTTTELLRMRDTSGGDVYCCRRFTTACAPQARSIDFSEPHYGLYCFCPTNVGGIVKLALRDKRKFNYVMLGALVLIVAVGALRYFGF